MGRQAETPLADVAIGIASGAVGTAVKDGYQSLVARIGDGGGGGAGGQQQAPRSWEQAPETARVARRMIEGVFQRDVPLSAAPAMATGVHWSYGALWGAVFGLVEASVRPRSIAHGMLFGAVVWGAAYVLLPAAKLYKPIWKYSPKVLAKDLSYHLVYGVAVGLAFATMRRLVRRA